MTSWGFSHVFTSAYGTGRSVARSRAAVVLATTALLGAAAPAVQAADGDQQGQGSASATVLRSGLTVSLLDESVEVPLEATLNAVSAPSPSTHADETLLKAQLDGVHNGQPFEMLRAEVANAEATSDADGSRAESSLVDATVHLPGLPGTSVIEVEAVTAEAVCATGAAPTADSNFGATANVLGQEVNLTTEGTVTVDAPGVGQVELALSQHETTDTTAAATALALTVHVDPLDLGVAAVDGEITLVEAACEAAGGDGGSGGGTEGASGDTGDGGEDGQAAGGAGDDGPATQTLPAGKDADLAETGGGSAAPYVAGAAVVLLAAGAGTLFYVRRRGANTAQG